MITKKIKSIEFPISSELKLVFDGEQESAYQLPLPKSLARIDLTGDTRAMDSVNPALLDFKYSDRLGNSLKLKASVTWQGSFSLGFPKKNYAIDLLNEDGESVKIKIGDWVAMDSYHLKANYVDFTQARNVVIAKVAHAVDMAYPLGDRFPWWEKPYDPANANLKDRIDDGARSVIDGFPVELYINGYYDGNYTFNIKKHRANYRMTKNNPLHIEVEAIDTRLPYPMNWSGVEIRNPSGIPSGTEPPAGPTKDAINTFLNWINNSSDTDFKSQANTYLYLDKILDFYVFVQAFCLADEVARNWQLCTWDGIRWALRLYDMDNSFGLGSDATYFDPPNRNPDVPEGGNAIFRRVLKNCRPELNARYAQLRNMFISYDYLEKQLREFMNTFGYDAFKADAERWPAIPSNSAVYTSLYQIMDWYKKRIPYLDSFFSYS